MCDTWVALADATRSGQVIFAKNSDRPVFDCQPLLLNPRQTWPSGSRVAMTYVDLPQVNMTWATLGSSPYWCWGYEEGMNEHGVVIGNEAIYTKTFREAATAHRAGHGPAPGVLGMDLIRLGLERSQTASQAVEVMGALIDEYGQFGSGTPTRSHVDGGYDNSFIIADPTEAWVLEAVGQRWVARRMTSGCFSISNEPTIQGEWDAGSADIEAYARQQGWWPHDAPFEFTRAYIDEQLPRQVSHIRVMRSRQLLADNAGQITPDWMKRIARDHLEDTFLGGPYFDAADPDFRTICMHSSPSAVNCCNTASSCVAVLPRAGDELPLFWWTAGPPCNGCYVPFFVHGGELPAIVSQAGSFGKRVVPANEAVADTFAPESYWWLFRQLNDAVKGDAVKSLPGYYPSRNRIVRERFDALEQDFAAQVSQVMQQALTADGINSAVLDAFTADCVSRVLAVMQDLLAEFDTQSSVSLS